MQESDAPSPVAGPTFEGMVDRALNSPEVVAALDAAGAGTSREGLRAEALEERARLVGVAAAEYGHYLALRAAAVDRYESLGQGCYESSDHGHHESSAHGDRASDGRAGHDGRGPGGPVADDGRLPGGSVGDDGHTPGGPVGDDAPAPGEDGRTRGAPLDDDVRTPGGAPTGDAGTQQDAPAGDARTRQDAEAGDGRTKEVLPVLAVLVPSLGAVATGVFLLCGFGLRAFAVRPHIGDGLVMAGVIAAAVTAGAALGDLAWILVTGARNRSGRRRGHPADRDPDVCRARETWENALLERGLVPFLRQRAESAGTDPAYAPEGRAVVSEEHAVGAENSAR
ncbi:hypothetical protein ACWD5Q_29045 [Streptomyces sp. NPDC002513]